MKTHTVTKDQVKNGKYIGKTDLSSYEGSILIEAGLGLVAWIGVRQWR